MNLKEAAALSGYCVWTLAKKARANEFGASKPRGNRGGWEIDEASFRSFMRRQKIRQANAFMQTQIKRGRVE